jgi:hypothetical protein
MLTSNFPGRKTSRRKGALKRMQDGSPRAQGAEESQESYEKYTGKRKEEIAILLRKVGSQ